jgi:beta-phosphoglucomutase-like phosphatase (HAD superfamily)
MKPRISALVFDLDGVLWDSNSAHEAAFESVAHTEGLKPVPYDRIAGMTTPEAWRLIGRANGREFGESELAGLTVEKRVAFLEMLHGVAIDDAALDNLAFRHPGIPWAIVTGASSASLAGFCARTTSAARFDVLVNADDGFASKPAPDSYLAAFTRLGVPAEECVVLEDSENGLKAADAAGALTVHIRGRRRPCALDHSIVGVRLLCCVPSLAEVIT